MKRFNRCIVLILLVFACILGGFGSTRDDVNTTILNTGYDVEDSTGTKLHFTKKPERIVSLTISTDEILLELVSEDRIAALTYLVDDPGISNAVEKSKTVLARLDGNSAEAILALKPDLVIVADFFKVEMIETLRELGIPVYVYKTQKNIQDVKNSIVELANVVGEPQNALPLLTMMDAKLAQIEMTVNEILESERKRVIYIQTNGATFRPESTSHDICKFAGVKEAALELNYQKNITLSKEEIVRLNPDAFVLSAWDYDGKHETQERCKEIQEDPAYQSIKAIKNHAIVALPGAHMQSLSHYIVYAIEDMAKAMYPEKFKLKE